VPYFEVTYTDGTVEEIEADECQDNGARYLTFVRYRIPFLWTVYVEVVRRLDGAGPREGRNATIQDLPHLAPA
jgi:hypothetical protein